MSNGTKKKKRIRRQSGSWGPVEEMSGVELGEGVELVIAHDSTVSDEEAQARLLAAGPEFEG